MTTMLLVITVTTAIAAALSSLGLREGVLRVRPEPRRCPTCGRRLYEWACSECTDG